MKEIFCRGVLFDLDGVLVDSTPAVERVWAGWALEHGFDPAEVTKAAHGRPSIDTIREYLPKGDVKGENAEVERREIEDVAGVVPLPGALELIRSLPPPRWTIVTSCTRRLAFVRIRAAGLPEPDQLVTSTDITKGKPDPEPYIKGAQILGISPADCIVIEDAAAGVRAGKAAGCRVIALRTTDEDSALEAAGADWIVKDCSYIDCDFARGVDPFRLLLY
ncbi:MAG: HAD family hydrolase [Candidatus Acidiferrales bacterium]